MVGRVDPCLTSAFAGNNVLSMALEAPDGSHCY
jgi:hypothetical protein